MKLSKLYPGSIYRLDNTDQVIELLTRTLAEASCGSLSHVWASSPHIKAVRTLATEHPGMSVSFQDYAASPHYNNYPLRKVMAAYVALETSPADSPRELESLSLFTDNIIKLIDHNNQCGLPNDDAYCLFISAGKLSKGETADTIQKYTFRHQELMQLLPTVIARCTVNNPFSKVVCADQNGFETHREPATPNKHGPTVMAHMGLTTLTYH